MAESASLVKSYGKRGSSITLQNKDTNLPVIISRKGLDNDMKRLPSENSCKPLEGSRFEYARIFKFKENKSIDAELKRLEEFKCKNRVLRK